MSDQTLDRLHALTARLTVCLLEAEDIRARLTRARRDATTWPDLRQASRPNADIRGASHLPASNAAGRRPH